MWDETTVVIEVIWVGAERKNFLLWDSTAPITPNLPRRAIDFFTGCRSLPAYALLMGQRGMGPGVRRDDERGFNCQTA